MKNKILLISLIFIAVVISFTSSCFAVDNDSIFFNIEIDNTPVVVNLNSDNNKFFSVHDVEHDYHNFIIVQYSTSNNTKHVCLLFYNDNQTLIYNQNGEYGNTFYTLDNSNFGYFTGTLSIDNILNATCSGMDSIYANTNVSVLYTSKDIYDIDNNLVFQSPPATQLTLAPVLEKVEMTGEKGILQEIIQILPVVLGVVVILLAIRKGIALIVQMLKIV